MKKKNCLICHNPIRNRETEARACANICTKILEKYGVFTRNGFELSKRGKEIVALKILA